MTGDMAEAVGKFLKGLDELSALHEVFIQSDDDGGFVLTWGNHGETLAAFQPVDKKTAEYGCSMLG